MPQVESADSSLWTCMTTDEGTQCEKWPWIIGLIVVLGASAGVVIWWKLRKRTKAREVVRDTADLEKVKKEFGEVVERKKKSKAAMDKDEAAAQKLTERMLELEARLNRKNRKNAG